mmetsp:Transcript_4329/g.9031  ORF Transcript_4329/g.9031 Transcript_4329/m.9031 type:complete len:116 (-) Transcript_4329:39-386(-)
MFLRKAGIQDRPTSPPSTSFRPREAYSSPGGFSPDGRPWDMSWTQRPLQIILRGRERGYGGTAGRRDGGGRRRRISAGRRDGADRRRIPTGKGIKVFGRSVHIFRSVKSHSCNSG